MISLGCLIFLACLVGTAGISSKTVQPDEEWTPQHKPWIPSLPEAKRISLRRTIDLYDKDEWAENAPRTSTEEAAFMASGTDGKANICVDGHFVPELIVIGAIKAASTSMCLTLRQSPALIWSRPSERDSFASKEAQHFDRYYNDGVNGLVNAFPQCNMSARFVAVDCTPAYSSEPHVARTIKNWYGTMLAPLLKFVLLIREPVARLHSHYHHSIRGHWCGAIQKLSFQQTVDHILEGQYMNLIMPPDGQSMFGCGHPFEAGCACNYIVEASLYTKQLHNYFKNFLSKQFLIVPMKFFVDQETIARTKSTVAESIWSYLGVKGNLEAETFHANMGMHTSLEADLTREKLSAIRAWFHNVTGPISLSRLLAQSGANLYGYGGQPGNVKTIAAWIDQNW